MPASAHRVRLIAVLALAAVCAAGLAVAGSCGGPSAGQGGGSGPPWISQSSSSSPDGGRDGGADGGLDGGFDAGVDGGCAGFAREITAVNDQCLVKAQATARLTGSCSQAMLTYLNVTCLGQLNGPRNAFTASCQGVGSSLTPCSSTSTPGTLLCVLDGGSTCTIAVCDVTDGGPCP